MYITWWYTKQVLDFTSDLRSVRYGLHTSVCSLTSTVTQFCFGTQFLEMIECVDSDSTVDKTQSFGDCHIITDTCNKHLTCMQGWVRRIFSWVRRIFSWVETTKLHLQSARGCARWYRDFAKMLRLRLKCDGTRAETRFRLSAKRTSPFKSAGGEASV